MCGPTYREAGISLLLKNTYATTKIGARRYPQIELITKRGL
jgi:hypothetical protein